MRGLVRVAAGFQALVQVEFLPLRTEPVQHANGIDRLRSLPHQGDLIPDTALEFLTLVERKPLTRGNALAHRRVHRDYSRFLPPVDGHRPTGAVEFPVLGPCNALLVHIALGQNKALPSSAGSLIHRVFVLIALGGIGLLEDARS